MVARLAAYGAIVGLSDAHAFQLVCIEHYACPRRSDANTLTPAPAAFELLRYAVVPKFASAAAPVGDRLAGKSKDKALKSCKEILESNPGSDLSVPCSLRAPAATST